MTIPLRRNREFKVREPPGCSGRFVPEQQYTPEAPRARRMGLAGASGGRRREARDLCSSWRAAARERAQGRG